MPRGGRGFSCIFVRQMLRSVFSVPKMDCPSEERLIRMAFDGTPEVAVLRFDLAARTVTVVHTGNTATLLAKLEPLGLGARLAGTEAAAPDEGGEASSDGTEVATLRVLLAINAVMFAVEFITGWIAQSTGLIADSFDMFADAMVYGLSLYAVGKAASKKLRAAHVSGVLQGVLAVGVFVDVVRRLLGGSEPEAAAMVGISTLALAANVSCLLLIARHRHGGAHMKASWIFSTNDVLANIGVITAGALVAWTGSRVPDLAIGAAVGLLVLVGASRILRLR